METKFLTTKDLTIFKELIKVFEDVFDMKNFIMPGDTYLQNLLGKEGFYVFVATLNDKVVGGLTAYTLHQYYSTSPLIYIYDLAVKVEHQRQGIGKFIISDFNKYCQQSGFEEVFVQADKVDDYAIDFYRSTGATAEEVVHFYFQLKAIKRD